MVWEMMRSMAGPYLCGAVDAYLIHQDLFNTIVCGMGVCWIFYDRKYRRKKAAAPVVKVMGMTIYGDKS